MGLGTRGCPISPAIKNDEIYKQHLLFVEANFLDFFWGIWTNPKLPYVDTDKLDH